MRGRLRYVRIGPGPRPPVTLTGIALDNAAPVALTGFSTGGLLAQHIVVDRPGPVDRLALLSTGSRLSAWGARTCRRCRELADGGRRLRAELVAAAVVHPGVGHGLLKRHGLSLQNDVRTFLTATTGG
jgi:alpha-beta hydrolase superfamily lysophospholipase